MQSDAYCMLSIKTWGCKYEKNLYLKKGLKEIIPEKDSSKYSWSFVAKSSSLINKNFL